MFSWGEDWQQGFRLKKASNVQTADGVHFLNLSFHIADLSAGHSVLTFVKSSGDAYIIRTVESKDEGRVRGKQKFVNCEEKIEAVCCGDDVVTLLSARGRVFCVDPARTPFIPRTPEGLRNIRVSQVACGSQHTVALTKDGQLYTWGQGSRGQLGVGTNKSRVDCPQHVRSLSAIPVVQVAAGGEQSLALSVSGGVFSWGRNECGQLGLGDTRDRHTPTLLHYLNMKKTVSISCGRDHTAVLTKDGAVFTFGSGQHGQLGHNSLQDELRPRLIAELWGSKVTKIACGSYHTLVLTESKKVYSFGCNKQGQLGHGEKSHPSVPLPVQLPHDTTNIYAGENTSFAICTPQEDTDNGSNSGTKNNVTQHSIDNMIGKWTSNYDPKSVKNLRQEIHGMLSSPFCMNQSFLDRRKDKHFQTSPKYSGLDLSLARHNFEKLVKSDPVLEEVEAAVLELLPSLDVKPVGVEGLRIFLLLSELLHAMQKCRQQQNTRLADAVADVMQRLPDESVQILGDWWCSLLPSNMVRHVQVWKQALSQILSQKSVSQKSQATNVLLILQHMYQANKRNKKIPETTFCFEINPMFLHEDLMRWRTKSKLNGTNGLPLILCRYPFVMDLKSKKMVFDMNSACTQREHQVPPLLYGGVPVSDPRFFELRLQRASLFEGTFRQLAAARHEDFKKPLVVYFDEDPKVTDVYKRDLFHHLFRNIVSAQSGMFMLNDSKTLAWFPSKATEEAKRNFFLFGVLCGLALYNQCIIHLPFPLVLFKKLLNLEPTLEDMMEFSPANGRRLQSILDYEDEVVCDLYMGFLITWDGTEVDLDPQTPGKPLTSQNKKEYVEAYVHHAFNTSVESVFQEFKRGFFQVCDQDLVRLFRPEELQGVLVGQDVYDWKKFKRNTVYEWVYHNHPTIQMFWEVFDELTEEQKKDFLRFLTGYRRVPILGMDQIQMKVRIKQIQSGSYDQHLPESLTCHSILELPLYSTKEIMRDRLTKALLADTEFTL
ncbi:probable E3 ubiquitin-protein ligase HERC3 [Archocentrus centrarchus]|uniref:probable E3 ubiquitin-protein ligase HERC3 n=1 Tax=Archocentrus centrarchus TaxID=63155 RepID=UPI0011EA4741|nr:probable E3 ubiquitin-protein ligase HERC3 [Archocentrus centrarchus]